MTGWGIKKFSDAVYEGEFDHGKREGKGKITFFHGYDLYDSYYEGGWFNDKREEYGVYRYNCMRKYEGYYDDDERSGKGKMTYIKGDVYEGPWKNDKRNGRGVETKANGITYEAFFLNDIKDGDGVKIENGRRINGHFYNDEFTERHYSPGVAKQDMRVEYGYVYDENGEKIGRIYNDGDVYDNLDKNKEE